MAPWKMPAIAFALGLALAGGGLWAWQRPSDTTAVLGVAIFVSDIDKSVAFYSALGLDGKEITGKTPRRRAQFNMEGSAGLQLYEAPPALHPFDMGTNYIRVMYTVGDVRAVCARMAATPLPCVAEPRPVDQSLVADLRDPDGYAVQIIQFTK